MKPPCAYCKPCGREMTLDQNEALGQVYKCEGCGAILEIGEGRPAIVLDRAPAAPPATTLNGGGRP